jgi:putative SOS response-associated peptidase YedK
MRVTQSLKSIQRVQRRTLISRFVNFDYASAYNEDVTAGRQLITIAGHNEEGKFFARTNFGTYIGETLIFNARSETLRSRPSWKNSVQKQRILVPVSSFYERGSFFHPVDENVFALAGITVNNPDGTHSAIVITRSAINEVAKVHHRMPVVMPEDFWNDWLNPDVPIDDFYDIPVPSHYATIKSSVAA